MDIKNLDKEKNKSLVLAAVKRSGLSLQYADESFKKDKSIVLAAVQENGLVLEDADESLQKDPDIIKAANK
jgi:ribosome biogenesis SPOUT family RNA methylase Rps3